MKDIIAARMVQIMELPSQREKCAAIEQQREGLVLVTGGQAAVSAVNTLLKTRFVLHGVASTEDGTGRFTHVLVPGETV